MNLTYLNLQEDYSPSQIIYRVNSYSLYWFTFIFNLIMFHFVPPIFELLTITVAITTNLTVAIIIQSRHQKKRFLIWMLHYH